MNLKLRIPLLLTAFGYFLLHDTLSASSAYTSPPPLPDREKSTLYRQTLPISFTPLSSCVLPVMEFNEVARALYSACCYDLAPLNGMTPITRYQKKFPDTHDDFKKYIAQIEPALKITLKFFEDLDDLKKKDVKRIQKNIGNRYALVKGISHCMFDFSNDDQTILERVFSHASNMMSGSCMVSEVTVNPNGTIQTLDKELQNEETDEIKFHPFFGKLCEITRDFTKGLSALDCIFKKLEETKRLAYVTPSTSSSTSASSTSESSTK